MSIRVASISSVQKSRVSISITLTIVSKTMASIGSIRSNSLGGSIKSLGEGIKTSAGGEWDTGSISVGSMSIRVASITSVEKSWVSFSITLTLASTRDREVSSIDTGSTLHTQAVAKSIGIAGIAGIASIASIASITSIT